MLNIQNSLVVPYKAEQMFFLVNDISSYSKFIPGCVRSYILCNGDLELTARIDILKFGIVQSFITHNFMIKNESIMVELVFGPCKSLFGSWRFIDCSDNFSRVECCFYYEFTSKCFEKMFGFFVQATIKDIIQSFLSRADHLYG